MSSESPTSVPASLFDLTGRVALVTGAGGGIGRAACLMLARAGAAVVCTDANLGRVEETAAAVIADGGVAKARAFDVTRADEATKTVDGILEDYGRLDILLTSAAILLKKPLLELEEADFDAVFAVNFRGTVLVSLAAARAMSVRGSGSIITVASAAIDVASPPVAAYGAAKAALTHFSRSLATEVGPSGVRVNVIAPGWVHTGMVEPQFRGADGEIDEGALEQYATALAGATPLRRNGEPEDIAATVLYLASDAAAWMTGQTLRPNGGATMP